MFKTKLRGIISEIFGVHFYLSNIYIHDKHVKRGFQVELHMRSTFVDMVKDSESLFFVICRKREYRPWPVPVGLGRP